MEDQNVIVMNDELSVRALAPLPVEATQPLPVTGVVRTISATGRYDYMVHQINGDEQNPHEANLVRYLQQMTSEGWEPTHIVDVPPYSYPRMVQNNHTFMHASQRYGYVVILRKPKA